MDYWRTSRRKLTFERPLVMAVLNVTPDSFSDGGAYPSVGHALRRAENMIAEGVDIIDIGGESTRPNSTRVSSEDEIRRTIPVIESIATRFNIPISIDTTKSRVATAAVEAGAEIINDISGLRFDEKIAEVAASSGTGLVLMHSRGEFKNLHSQQPVDDIVGTVKADFGRAIDRARLSGVEDDQIVLDVGIGFAKTLEQNLELLAKLDTVIKDFCEFPMLVGSSRKSFIGKLLNGVEPNERLSGSLASVAIAIFRGAKIIRTHDVKATADAIKVAHAIRKAGRV